MIPMLDEAMRGMPLDGRVNKVVVEYRRNLVARFYLRGISQADIARTLSNFSKHDVTPMTVSRDLKVIREKWRAEANSSYADHKAIQLKKLDEVEAAAWQGWEASKGETTIGTMLPTPPAPGGAPTPATPVKPGFMKKKSGAGNPRFLEVALNCVDKRCKILGLYADEPNSPEDDRVLTIEVAFQGSEPPAPKQREVIEHGHPTAEESVPAPEPDGDVPEADPAPAEWEIEVQPPRGPEAGV